jgi:hypothetical protein
MNPVAAEISLVSIIDVTRLLEPADWFIEGVRRCSQVTRDYKAEVLSLVRRESNLRRRLGCASSFATLSGEREILASTLSVSIGNCTAEQVEQISSSSGPWSLLSEREAVARITPTMASKKSAH